MLRLVVLILLLANGAYFAWSQGLLRPYGYGPTQQSEPQRIAQQLNPGALRILKADEVKRAEAAPAAVKGPVECLQAGLFDDIQAAALRRSLETLLPAGAWVMEGAVEPARWIIYMGKYPNADALAKKRTELASLKLKFEPLTNPALEIGLSLGGFETRGAAEAALTTLTRRGVRTARVVQEQAEMQGAQLTIAAADDSLKTRFEALKPALVGKPLHACK
jgi:hypothetical protein